MHSRSLARELALLVLGQTSESDAALDKQPALDGLLQKALDSLMLLWRETLDGSAAELERAQQSRC
jgi:N utilization substance protein B